VRESVTVFRDAAQLRPLGEIPLVGFFTGCVLHPAYRVSRAGGEALLTRAVKQMLAVLSMLMMLLLERRRG
jgi:hypothetical protein